MSRKIKFGRPNSPILHHLKKKEAIYYILNQSRNGSFELPCKIWKKTLIE